MTHPQYRPGTPGTPVIADGTAGTVVGLDDTLAELAGYASAADIEAAELVPVASIAWSGFRLYPAEAIESSEDRLHEDTARDNYEQEMSR